MGEWVWGAVVLSIVILIAGAIAWWLAKGCMVTRIGAVGAIAGALASLVALAVLLEPGVALTVAAALTAASGVWLLAWSIAGGIRGQRMERAAPRT